MLFKLSARVSASLSPFYLVRAERRNQSESELNNNSVGE
jgi:hypothetical protein